MTRAFKQNQVSLVILDRMQISKSIGVTAFEVTCGNYYGYYCDKVGGGVSYHVI